MSKLPGKVNSKPSPNVEIRDLNWQYARVKPGETVRFIFTITNHETYEWPPDSMLKCCNKNVSIESKSYPLRLKRDEQCILELLITPLKTCKA